jgi:hypothetical protein
MRRVMELRLHPDNRRVVEAWSWWQAEKDRQRLVVASEDTAKAALASADSARESVRQAGRSALWAFCSSAVAAAILIVAILSYLKAP